MKKNSLFISGLIALFLFVGCHPPDKKLTLGADYYLTGNKEIPAGIKLVHGVNDNFEDIVLGEIVAYKTDTYFILIHRKVTDAARNIFEDNPLWKKQLKGNDQYWIIEKRFDGISGPMDYQEYLLKRKQLQVSDGVNLEN